MAVFDPFDSVNKKPTVSDSDKVLMYIDSPTKSMQWTTVASIKGSSPSPSPTANIFNPTINLDLVSLNNNFSNSIAQPGKEYNIGEEPASYARKKKIGDILQIENLVTEQGQSTTKYIDIVDGKKVVKNLYGEILKFASFSDVNAIKLNNNIRRLMSTNDFVQLGLGTKICSMSGIAGHMWFWTVPDNVCVAFSQTDGNSEAQLIIAYLKNINDREWKPLHVGPCLPDECSSGGTYTYIAYLKKEMVIAVGLAKSKKIDVGELSEQSGIKGAITATCYPVISF